MKVESAEKIITFNSGKKITLTGEEYQELESYFKWIPCDNGSTKYPVQWPSLTFATTESKV